MAENSADTFLREYVFETKKGGKDIVIGQISDIHLSAVNDEDMRSYEIADTYFHRKWLRDSQALPMLDSALEYCKDFDQTVITGDVLDYYSTEAKKLIGERFEKYNILACIGGHDLTLEMETAMSNKLSLEERYALLSDFWCNDVHFASRVLGDKVCLIALDDNTELWRESRERFDESQYDKLKICIDEARANGYIILMFMHEPIATGHDGDEVCDLFNGSKRVLPCDMSGEFTEKAYDLIINSADVIKGVFVGHRHMDFVTDIEAGYTKDGVFVKENIKMVCVTSNAYSKEGRVVKITVK